MYTYTALYTYIHIYLWRFRLSRAAWPATPSGDAPKYAQSAYQECQFHRVRLKQTLNSKVWEFSCLYNLIGGLPESLTH